MEAISQLTRDWLSEQLGVGFQIEKHVHSHQDEVYRIQARDKNVYLKIASNLKRERDNLQIAAPYLQVPKVLGFNRLSDKDNLLISEVPGKNLVELIGEWSNEAIVKEFARATRALHELDADKLFPGQTDAGHVVLHGDMALPNILCTAPGSRYYIDVGQMHVGSPDTELADAIWSLQRNIGPDYGELFLKEYGSVTMTETIDKALKYRYIPHV